MSFLGDFKKFALKGNVIDLAVAVIIGGAFGKIIGSLVNDVIMPSIGVLIGNVDFKELKAVLVAGQDAVMNGDQVVSEAVKEVTLNYGMFIQNIVDFIIIAFVIFLVIRSYQRMSKKEEIAEAPAPPPAPTKQEILLEEIRDLLKKY